MQLCSHTIPLLLLPHGNALIYWDCTSRVLCLTEATMWKFSLPSPFSKGNGEGYFKGLSKYFWGDNERKYPDAAQDLCGTAACYKYVRTIILLESVLVERVDCMTIIKLLYNACDDVQRPNKKIMKLVNVTWKHPVTNGIRVFFYQSTQNPQTSSEKYRNQSEFQWWVLEMYVLSTF